jgi:hypothetical protein
MNIKREWIMNIYDLLSLILLVLFYMLRYSSDHIFCKNRNQKHVLNSEYTGI